MNVMSMGTEIFYNAWHTVETTTGFTTMSKLDIHFPQTGEPTFPDGTFCITIYERVVVVVQMDTGVVVTCTSSERLNERSYYLANRARIITRNELIKLYGTTPRQQLPYSVRTVLHPMIKEDRHLDVLFIQAQGVYVHAEKGRYKVWISAEKIRR